MSCSLYSSPCPVLFSPPSLLFCIKSVVMSSTHTLLTQLRELYSSSDHTLPRLHRVACCVQCLRCLSSALWLWVGSCKIFLCKMVVVNSSSPTVLAGGQYWRICQHWLNVSKYATLCDTTHKIPVYFAYRYKAHTNLTRNDRWKI